MTNENELPTDLIEVSDDIAALINGTDPDIATPAPTDITPASPATPAESTPPSADVPEWFQDVDPSARAAVVQRALEALSPEERNSIPLVQEVARNASANTAAQVQGYQSAEQQQALRDNAFDAAVGPVVDEIRINLHPESTIDITSLVVNNIVPATEARYHDMMAANIEQGLKATMNYLGITEIPAATMQRIAQAQDYGGVIDAYGRLMAERGFDLGRIAEKGNLEQNAKVDKAAMTARYKSWGIAQAAKDGRLRISKDDEGLYAELINDTPVPLGSGAVAGGGDDLSQEEFNQAVADPDYQEKLLSNPAKKAAWDRAIADAMIGV